MKKLAALLILAGLCAMLFVSGPVSSQGLGGQKGNSKFHRKANKITNNYIVVLDDDVVGEKGTLFDRSIHGDRHGSYV